jgi:hypothetical protein
VTLQDRSREEPSRGGHEFRAHGPDRQDRAFGRVDDRREGLHAEHPQVRDRERALATAHELARGGSVHDPPALFGDPREVARLRFQDDRHDQTPVRSHGDADIDILRVLDPIGVNAAAHARLIAERDGGSAHDQVVDGDFRALRRVRRFQLERRRHVDGNRR